MADDPTPRARSAAKSEEERIGLRMAGLGFTVASEAAAGAALGWLFDRWQGTAPTGLLVGSIAGIAVAMWSLIGGALRMNRELDRPSPIDVPRRSVRDETEDDAFANSRDSTDDESPSDHFNSNDD